MEKESPLKKLTSPTKEEEEEGKKPDAAKGKGTREDAFSDFGSYMVEKVRKLQEQYTSDATNQLLSSGKDDQQGSIFAGVTIFVNGYTNPTHQELRHLMLRHGGRFENYYSNTRVTHIVCNNLPHAKLLQFRTMKKLPPIVKPTWVTDSIEANRVLPVGDYGLERLLYDHPGQQTLPRSPLPANGELPPHPPLPSPQPPSEQAPYLPPLLGEQQPPESSPLPPPRPEDPLEEVADTDDEDEAPPPPTKRARIEQLPEFAGPSEAFTGELRETREQRGGMGEMEGRASQREEQQPEPDSLAIIIPEMPAGAAALGVIGPLTVEEELAERAEVAPGGGAELEGEDWKEIVAGEDEVSAVRLAVGNSPEGKRGHSTKDDPNFIQSYYKHSRLHFIGTWRNRYPASGGRGEGHVEQPREGVGSRGQGNAPRVIMHIDMDCFFVSVVVRGHPELEGKPVAVCHSDGKSGAGSAEISSANYAARVFGIKAGMFIREAKRRCPELLTMPYDFEAYEKVSDQVYEILHRRSNIVQAISCDEAFIDASGCGDPEALASEIRREIREVTGCPASIGVSHNMLLARLATQRAKPNGQFFVSQDKAADFIAELPVSKLHGVGWSLREKLEAKGITLCAQLRSLSKESLQREFGAKTGDMLWSYARGIGPSQLQPAQERKSIGAEVNWGVRFTNDADAFKFLEGLAEEVAGRLRQAGMRGRTILLKVKKRKPGAGEPAKFMGCGICDNFNRSATVGMSTDDPAVLRRVSKQLYTALRMDAKEVRGVGLQMSRLEPAKGPATGAGIFSSIQKQAIAASAVPPLPPSPPSPPDLKPAIAVPAFPATSGPPEASPSTSIAPPQTIPQESTPVDVPPAGAESARAVDRKGKRPLSPDRQVAVSGDVGPSSRPSGSPPRGFFGMSPPPRQKGDDPRQKEREGEVRGPISGPGGGGGFWLGSPPSRSWTPAW